MSLNVSGLTFDGPYLSTDDLDDRSGVYLIVDQADGQNHAIDCGSRQMCGDASHRMIAAIVGRGVRAGNLPLLCVPPPGMQQTGRREIESTLRKDHAFPCGDR